MKNRWAKEKPLSNEKPFSIYQIAIGGHEKVTLCHIHVPAPLKFRQYGDVEILLLLLVLLLL